MNSLNPHAARQASLDAGAKVALSTERRSLFSWLLTQRLRTQFLIVFATLFVAYAGASVILSATGLRAPPEPKIAAKKKKKPEPICNDAGMSASERAKCIVEHEPPAEIRRVGTEARINAEKISKGRVSEEERYKLQEELAKARDAKRLGALRADFERRMAEMIGGQLKLPDFASRQAYYEDTVVVMAEMLQLSDHPMKHSRGQKLSGDFYADDRSGKSPAGGYEAENRLKAICGIPPMPPERHRACAAVLRDSVLQLRYTASKGTLQQLVFSVRP